MSVRHTVKSMIVVCAVAALAPAVAAPTAAGAATPGPSGPAVEIVLDRQGGFAGLHDTFLVDRETAGGQKALRLAGSRAFQRLRDSYQPANPCCDRFSYVLSVTYRGGAVKTVSTVQGTEAPRILWDVIAETRLTGSRWPARSL